MSLFCLFLGEAVEDRFEVSTKKKRTVYRLQEAIKNKNENYLKDIDARKLRLWKVAIPTGYENDKLKLLNSKSHDQINLQQDLGGKFLDAGELIEDHFERNTKTTKQISILIQLPGKYQYFIF